MDFKAGRVDTSRPMMLPFRIAVGLLALLIFSILILSFVPPVSKDELAHHLALPKLYLKHGGMYEIPHMSFSYYPMNLQILYTVPLYFGNDIIPKLIHFAFALLTAWLVFSYLEPRIDRLYALSASLFLLSIPVIVKLSITAYVDLGVVFFSTASLLWLLKWAENKFKLRYLLASALMCGLGMGTKYSGLVSFILLTLLTPILYGRFRKNGSTGIIKPLGFGLLFFIIGLIVFSPWMARNYGWTKNPIYPLFAGFFQAESKGNAESVQEEGSGGRPLGIFVIRKEIYHEKGWEIALVPIRVFFQGQDGSPRYFDGKLNPILLILPFFAFFRRERESEDLKNEKKVLLAFALLFFAIAFCTRDLRIRYITPIIPPLVILSAFGVKRIYDWAGEGARTWPRRLKTCLPLLLAFVALLYNGKYIFEQFRYVDPLGYLTAEVSRDEYISRYRPEYPAIQFINGNLPAQAKVLFLFLGGRGYFCDREYILGDEGFSQLIQRAKTEQDIYSGLHRTGVTHMLIYHPLFERWAIDNFPDEKRQPLEKFFKDHVQVLFLRDGFSVSSLRSPES